MTPISTDPTIDALLSANAPVAVGVSGGKDSQAAALATFDHLDRIGHRGQRLLIHSDLGSVEWNESLPVCQRLADHLATELMIVRRGAGDLMDRWEARWQSSVRRYENLETVTLVLPWSTPAMRFCTSELKTHIITRELRRRFDGAPYINVTGVRREESAARGFVCGGRRMNFAEFKASAPARSMFRKLGLLDYLDSAGSWRSLRHTIVDFNDCDQGNFVKLARQCDGVCSSGERILLHAICYVTDFAWLADELAGVDKKRKTSRVWQNMDRASGEFQRCVAACIAAEVY